MRPAGEQGEERARHFRESLARALGPAVMRALAEPDVNEIYVNPDGRLFLDTRSGGRVAAGVELGAEQVQRFLNLVASSIPSVINPGRPQLQAELPAAGFRGARLQGFVWPLAAGPSFNLRKPPTAIYSLASYVEGGAMTAGQLAVLEGAIGTRRNILVAGGTASGKTTLVNALLLGITTRFPTERIVILEDTVELQCAARDHLALRTTDGVKLKDLVKAALRTCPDRIVVGEVRDEAALDLLDAWETGHPGGCATVHADDVLGALHRLDRLAQRNGVGPQPYLVGSAIDLVVVIAGSSRGRRVTGLVAVEGYEGAGYRLRDLTAGGGA
ncbi:MAG TPA: P-type conjugative transfer ATPase TrbB [Thermoanaerobaculia bacterium]|nr:P-type conjugative transfer ATPase TrbB [Thermoanaerobaculia bacterium]